MKHEIKEITILRSFAILILLLTHLHDYVDLWWLWKIYPVCANICLSIFVFISGYCLALGKEIGSLKNLFDFFKRKTVRIYSLYIPALVIFFIFYEHNYANKFILFIDHLLGLQLFLANFITPYFTIWYIGLIIPYYFLYGFSNYLNSINRMRCGEESFKSIVKNISSVLIIFFIIFSVLSIYSIFDKKIVFYFPSFIAGVVLSENGYLSHRGLRLRTFLYFTISSLLLLLLFYVCKSVACLTFLSQVLRVAVKIAYICMIPFSFVFVIHRIVLEKGTVPKWLHYLSYSSYAIYLFHRPILSGAKSVLSYSQLENTYILLALYLFIIFPFIVLPISYVIQKSVDKPIENTANQALVVPR